MGAKHTIIVDSPPALEKTRKKVIQVVQRYPKNLTAEQAEAGAEAVRKWYKPHRFTTKGKRIIFTRTLAKGQSSITMGGNIGIFEIGVKSHYVNPMKGPKPGLKRWIRKRGKRMMDGNKFPRRIKLPGPRSDQRKGAKKPSSYLIDGLHLSTAEIAKKEWNKLWRK
jgi:hypothetical protein